MNDSRDKPALNSFEELRKWATDLNKKHEERAARERARRAALTPEQRAAEDRQTIFRAYAAMTATVLGRESWTISQFAWLLIAEHPTEHAAWTSKKQRAIREMLESCVGATLSPINSTARPEDQRFRIADLIEVAEAKRLGYVAHLRVMLEHAKFAGRPTLRPKAALPERSSERSAAPAALPEQRSGERSPAPAPLPERSASLRLAAAGTATRERGVMRRRKQLVEFVRELVAAGEGVESPGLIQLSINGETLNERFRAKYPEWREISNKTLDNDRRGISPHIEVAQGRPRKDSQ